MEEGGDEEGGGSEEEWPSDSIQKKLVSWSSCLPLEDVAKDKLQAVYLIGDRFTVNKADWTV